MVTTTARVRRYWDRHAHGYDRQIAWPERRFFPGTRDWICSRARGDVLEVAVGTGLNLPHYPADVRLTAVDLSPAMLAVARDRAARLGRDVVLTTGDAQALDFTDGSFDTVVSTLSLCTIPDDRRAVDEMIRVLRPGGLLLLADHVEADVWWARAAQALADLATVPLEGEHYRRRLIRQVRARGLAVQDHQRFAWGIIEQFAARKAGPERPASVNRPAPRPGGRPDGS